MIEGFFYKRKKKLKKKLKRLDAVPIYTVVRDAYESNNYRRIREALFELLWTVSNDKVTKGIVNNFLNCIKNRDAGNSNFESGYKDFINFLSGLSYENYSFTQWYKLRAACNVVSLFEAGLVCRNKSKEAVLACEVENEYVMQQKFHVYMEQKEYEKAYVLVKKLNNPKIHEIYKFYTGENNDDLFSSNKKFDRFVTENKILIAGPAPLSDEEKEINLSAYKILKLNYRGKEDYFGKPDISFYGRLILLEMEKDKDMSIKMLKELDYSVFKGLMPEWCNDIYKGNALSLDANSLMYMDASVNGIPCVVYFLCRKTTIKPLLVGTNLFAGKLYRDDYGTGINYQKKHGYSLSRSSAKHDPTAQFLFMKRAYEAGLFETTSELQEILSLSEEEYIKRYQANIWQQGC